MTSLWISMMLFMSCHFEYHMCVVISDLLIHLIELENVSNSEINWGHIFLWVWFYCQACRLVFSPRIH